MYKTILVPVEPSHGQQLEGALAVAKTLAEGGGAEIHAVTVVEPVPGHFSMAKSLPDLRIKAGERAQTKLQEILGEGSGINPALLIV